MEQIPGTPSAAACAASGGNSCAPPADSLPAAPPETSPPAAQQPVIGATTRPSGLGLQRPLSPQLEVLEMLSPAGTTSCFVRCAGLRPGLETGDVVAWIDPATRQPYGVVWVEGGGPHDSFQAPAESSPRPAASSRVSPLKAGVVEGSGVEKESGGTYVLTLLDATSPEFKKGSCWLEVYKQVRSMACASCVSGGFLMFLNNRKTQPCTTQG